MAGVGTRGFDSDAAQDHRDARRAPRIGGHERIRGQRAIRGCAFETTQNRSGRNDMTSWSEFEAREPEMAAAGKKLLYQFGVGLAFLATVRKDGAPRLHPICPTVVDGDLYALILPVSPKCGDLKRDG